MFWYCHTAPVLFTGIVLSKQSAESCVLNKYYTVFTWPSWNMNKSSLFENIVLELQWNSVIASSGRPRHIFSLLPSSRYSQMTNLPRETTGNHLGENANGTVRTRARRRWEEGEGRGGEGERGLHTAQGRAFRCFSLLPATTRCALPGTWRRGGGGASGENFCGQEG